MQCRSISMTNVVPAPHGIAMCRVLPLRMLTCHPYHRYANARAITYFASSSCPVMYCTDHHPTCTANTAPKHVEHHEHNMRCESTSSVRPELQACINAHVLHCEHHQHAMHCEYHHCDMQCEHHQHDMHYKHHSQHALHCEPTSYMQPALQACINAYVF